MGFGPLDLLYRLTDRDQAGAFWYPIYEVGNVSVNSADFSVFYLDGRLGRDHLYVVTSVAMIAFPGSVPAARSVAFTAIQLTTEDANRTILTQLATGGAQAVGVPGRLNWSGNVIAIPGRTRIEARGGFDAAQADNNVQIATTGIAVPLGNLSSFLSI